MVMMVMRSGIIPVITHQRISVWIITIHIVTSVAIWAHRILSNVAVSTPNIIVVIVQGDVIVKHIIGMHVVPVVLTAQTGDHTIVVCIRVHIQHLRVMISETAVMT